MRHDDDATSWTTQLGALDDRSRARVLAVRIGRRGLIFGVAVAAVVLLQGDQGYRLRHGISAWWLVALGPLAMLVAGAIIGALLRHATTEQLAAMIVGLAALPGTIATAAVLNKAGAGSVQTTLGFTVVIACSCAICSWMWRGAVHALHEAAFAKCERSAQAHEMLGPGGA